VGDLGKRLRDQARLCRAYGSPLTGALLEGAADDLAAGGVVADLLGPHAAEPAGSVLPLRLAGALHRLVLQGSAPELARHYPGAGGTAPVEEVWPAAARAVREHLELLRHCVTLPVQTNEVGRSAVLYGLLLQLGTPVRLLELGASAGLNLRCDHYAYDVDGQVLGDPDSPVRLVEPWRGSPPPYGGPPVVTERLGCDPNPLDPTTAEGQLTLASCVWGDQVDRLARLRAACEVAAQVPVRVERGGALRFLQRHLTPLPPEVTTVVWHSVVWQYVDPHERAAVDALLREVGATAGGRLVRASMEPDRVGDRPVFTVRLQRYPDPPVVVATAPGHGLPVTWNGATMGR
jgi:hypothetical protein